MQQADIWGVDLVTPDEETRHTPWATANVSTENPGECVKDVFQLSGVAPGLIIQLLYGQTLGINTILI